MTRRMNYRGPQHDAKWREGCTCRVICCMLPPPWLLVGDRLVLEESVRSDQVEVEVASCLVRRLGRMGEGNSRFGRLHLLYQ